VAPQLSSGQWHNYSTKTRQVGQANEQSMYSPMSMQSTLFLRLEVRIQGQLGIKRKWRYNTRHNDTQHTFSTFTPSIEGLNGTHSISDTQHNNTLSLCWVSLSIYYYSECRVLLIIMLHSIMPSVACISGDPSLCPYTRLSISLSVCISISLSILTVSLSVSLIFSLSECLSVGTYCVWSEEGCSYVSISQGQMLRPFTSF